MQRVFLVKLILIASVFSFPSHKNAGKDALLENGKQLMDKQRRNLIQFGTMIQCATPRSFWDYMDYGCYCGYGGRGTPVDALDRCCYVHDACYGHIQNHPHLCTFSSAVYWAIYKRRGCTGCADRVGTCERAICECDGEAARCFARSPWNRAYYDYPQSRC